jgi:hypothetical protein
VSISDFEAHQAGIERLLESGGFEVARLYLVERSFRPAGIA